jgi:hypothetical protein
VLGDLLAVYVELGEERLVECGAYQLVALLVGSLRGLEQGECVVEDLSAEFQALVGSLDGLPDACGFLTHGVDLGPEC